MRLSSPTSLRRLTMFGCLAAVAVAVSACGGSSGSSSSSESEPETTAATTEAPATTATTGGGTVSGKVVFVDNCGSCHTLAAAGTDGQVGPDLDDLKPDTATVVNQVTNGGGGMPAFGSQLSQAQIQAVSKYVSSVAG